MDSELAVHEDLEAFKRDVIDAFQAEFGPAFHAHMRRLRITLIATAVIFSVSFLAVIRFV